MIYLTSDLHFCHDRGFIYEPRGFKTIDEMNEYIVGNWNKLVSKEDDVFILGDLMLNDNEKGIKLISRLNGKLHIIRGNHDTDNRIKLYKNLENVIDVCDARYVNYKGYHFFLTHYPCFTGCLEKESLKKTTCNLFGHTHSKDKFYEDIPFMYNVALDAHGCFPVSIDQAIQDMEDKIIECMSQL